jgi:hypothetical protein
MSNFHEVEFQASNFPGFDWLIVGLPFSVADWLAVEPIADALFFERDDWFGARSSGTKWPW